MSIQGNTIVSCKETLSNTGSNFQFSPTKTEILHESKYGNTKNSPLDREQLDTA